MKTCALCRKDKPRDQYTKRSSAKDGLYSYCKDCSRDYSRQRHLDNPERSRGYRIKREYGLSVEDFDALLARQHGLCAICQSASLGIKGRRLAVDHEHETGKVRGLLCHSCNVALGHMKDSPERLRAAANYLESFK